MGPGLDPKTRRLPLTSRPLHCYVACLFIRLQSAISSWRCRVYRRNQFISDTKEINSGYLATRDLPRVMGQQPRLVWGVAVKS